MSYSSVRAMLNACKQNNQPLSPVQRQYLLELIESIWEDRP